MYLTNEQSRYVFEHLRNPEKAYAIGAYARSLAYENETIQISAADAEIAALIMNIGETSENMKINGVSIYSEEFGPWGESAKKLNEIKGLESISMATSQGIELTDEAKQAIIACSRGGTLNNMAITLKVAQTLEAIKHPRWSRGEKKEPAQNIDEVSSIISEEVMFMIKNMEIDETTKMDIAQSMVSSARKVYSREKQQSIRRLLGVFSYDEAKSMQEGGIDFDDSNAELGLKLDKLFMHIPEDEIDAFFDEISSVTATQDISESDKTLLATSVIKKWESKYQLIDQKDKGIK